MTRSIQIELSAKNVLLILGALLTFGVAIAIGVRFLGRQLDTPAEKERGHADEKKAEHGEGEHGEGEHGEGEHGEGEHGEGEHGEEGHIKLSPEAFKNAGIEISTAASGDVNVTLALPGEISLNQEALAHVTPRVGGTVREVKKQIGENVKKGELLAILESRDLAEAQREYLASKERVVLAEATFERAELLQKENISATKDYLAAKQALAEAKIDYRGAAQKLRAIGGGKGGAGGYALVAPLAGTIVEKHINVGEVLTDQTRAFTIADLSTIWVNVTVYAKDLPRVAVGQVAEVRAEGIAEPAQGTIAYLGQMVGEQTRSATARVVLKNPGSAWRPGLFATAEVGVERGKAAVVVKDAAVQTVEGKDVVFLQEGDAFEARPVKLGRKGSIAGRKDDHVVEVLDGVKVGERYVSKNSFILKAELGKSEAGHEH